jgi:hypothetical protein
LSRSFLHLAVDRAERLNGDAAILIVRRLFLFGVF